MQDYITFLPLKKKKKKHLMVQCLVTGWMVSLSLPLHLPYDLFLLYVTSVRGLDHSITYLFIFTSFTPKCVYMQVFLKVGKSATKRQITFFTLPTDKSAFLLFFDFVCHNHHHKCNGKTGNSRNQQILHLIKLHPEDIKIGLNKP